jgi:hypothetical protein
MYFFLLRRFARELEYAAQIAAGPAERTLGHYAASVKLSSFDTFAALATNGSFALSVGFHTLP